MNKKHALILLFFIYFNTFSQVFISELRVVDADSLVNIKQSIKLNLEQNRIAITFADKSDLIPNFEYKLENTELKSKKDKWIKANEIRSISYENLYGGKYVFHAKNLHNQTKTSITFEIEPIFWQNWWFIPMMSFYTLIVISIVIYLILLYRFRQQTKLQRVRDNIASDLHDDVGATLSSISFFGEMMRSKIVKNAPKEEVLPLLDKLISTSKETIETMRGVVWTINPNNDNAVDFFQKLQSFGKEMLSAKNIAYHLTIEGFENVKLPLDIQRNFFLFYKETINNIAKHSKATVVKASIKPQKEGIEFSINDNGVGFNPTEIYEGHGLKSLRKRAEEMEASLDIQSTEGKGTNICLNFTLP